MANQYQGRPLTDIEECQQEHKFLLADNERVQRQLGECLEMMTSIYKDAPQPDLARLLIIHGVDVYTIDKEAGRETVYTTPRRLAESQAEAAATGQGEVGDG